MHITMDRYEADWAMVERGWETHVHGEGRQFASARDGDRDLPQREPGVIDQDLPPFVIARDGKPVGPIDDGDAVVFFNFRGDRAIEISARLRGGRRSTSSTAARGRTCSYAGMMQYDGDLKMPKRFLVAPPAIDRTLGEYLASNGVAPARDQRDAEVRPRHLLLERQPLRQVRRGDSRTTSRSRPTSCRSSSGRG